MSAISDQATAYAALILQDDNVEITADKLQTLIKAAGVDIEAIWSSIFAKALEGQDLSALLMNIGSGAAAPSAGGAAAAGGAAEAAAEEEKEEEKEESDDDMGFGLFD